MIYNDFKLKNKERFTQSLIDMHDPVVSCFVNLCNLIFLQHVTHLRPENLTENYVEMLQICMDPLIYNLELTLTIES